MNKYIFRWRQWHPLLSLRIVVLVEYKSEQIKAISASLSVTKCVDTLEGINVYYIYGDEDDYNIINNSSNNDRNGDT